MILSEDVQKKYNNIAEMLSSFCTEVLKENKDDFKDIFLKLLDKLSRKRPTPLLGGTVNTWAAGIAYAIGQINYIFDKTQNYYISATELAAYFGISASTAGNKAAEIRKICKLNHFDNKWLLPIHAQDNPMTWMITINGLIVDIRDMPLELQEQAFRAGVIPYIPGIKTKTTNEEKTKPALSKNNTAEKISKSITDDRSFFKRTKIQRN